ncbi:MAG: hypothetical protein ABFE13_11975 [Phycisphaerales bacterium]
MASIEQQIRDAVPQMLEATVSLRDDLNAEELIGKALANLMAARRDVFGDTARTRRCALRSMVYCALALSLLPAAPDVEVGG